MRLKEIGILTLLVISTHISATEKIVKTEYDIPWKNVFEKYELPDSFCTLPKYKTGFNIKYSKDRYVGAWGLTAPVARHYGLRIDDAIDERLDPIKSAQTAAKYLKDLTKIYRNKDLAAMAYLNGPTLVNDVAKKYKINIDSVNIKDIEAMWNLMPFSTKNDTIPCSMKDTVANIYTRTMLPNYKAGSPIRTKTICDTLKIDSTKFAYFNPSIKDGGKWINNIEIWLPTNETDSIIKIKIEALYEIEKSALERYNLSREESIRKAISTREKEIKKANAVQVYRVKSGDTLSYIAKRYKVSVRQLKSWNNLHSDFLKIGQRIKIKKL